MGRQIGYYMDSRDEVSFIAHLRTTGDIAIVPQTSREDMTEEFKTFSESDGRLLGDNICLWNRSISPRPIMNFIPQQNVYWLNQMQFEVVEVWRSKMIKDGLGRGRLWMETSSLTSDNRLQAKSGEFVAWYGALCRWIKKQAVDVVDGAYVLPGANELVQNGQKLIGHVP